MEEAATKAVVSTLAVEWIEMYSKIMLCHRKGVSTLAVEWIEILEFVPL